MPNSSEVGPRRAARAHSNPKRQGEDSSTIPLFAPNLFHDFAGDLCGARWFRPFLARDAWLLGRRKNPLRDQLARPLVVIVERSDRYQLRHRRIPVENEHLFAALYVFDVGAELGLQFADLRGSHCSILPDVTNLVMLRPTWPAKGTQTGRLRLYTATPACCEIDSTFPSGSLNQATLSPVGKVQMPRSSWPMFG